MSSIRNFYRESVRTKLVVLLLLISIIPIIIVSVFSYINGKNSIKHTHFENLRSIGILKTEMLNAFLDDKVMELGVLSTSNDIKQSVDMLMDYHVAMDFDNSERFVTESSEYKQLNDDVHRLLNPFMSKFEFQDLFIICADHGHVMYTDLQNHDLGANLVTGELKESSLAKVWRRVINTKDYVIVDFAEYEPSFAPASFIGAPVFDNNNNIRAVLALQLNIDNIDKILQMGVGVEERSETYLVGDDYLMRSNSSLSELKTFLVKRVDMDIVTQALNGESGVTLTKNNQGTNVLSYYSPVNFHDVVKEDFKWVIISEINKKDAFASINLLRNELILITLLVILAVFFIATGFAKGFTKPILRITDSAKALAVGDLTVKPDVASKDEIGDLAVAFGIMQDNLKEKADQAIQISKGILTFDIIPMSEKDEMGNAFKIMVEKLRKHIGEINEVVAVVTSSNSQLMTTISELSASSSETATTISEISSTIEEVKQTVEVSSQKAENVSNTAQQSVKVSEAGIISTEDSIEGMQQIQQQVKLIADTIIKLSEHSQVIGEITSSVNDLAEQSNLLAVNASIEAVKAGEYGKGFGVVAQEIRALADQSKQSTRQIKDILNDVQKAISSSVLATEQGGKAVEKGVGLSEAAGESIAMLADKISEAAQASVQIVASSNQQLTGIEQLADAILNISQAANQNATATMQAEDAASNLKQIIENLKSLVGEYKLN